MTTPNGECRVEGCTRPVRIKKRQLCRNHYAKWQTNPDRDLNGDLRGNNAGRPRKLSTDDSKRCPKCGEWKSLDHFHKRSDGTPLAYCVPCQNQWNLDRYYRIKAERGPLTFEKDFPCTFEGCDRPRSARGLCKAHHQQEQLGRPLTPIREWTEAPKTEDGQRCTGCREHKPWSDFYGRGDGRYQQRCKQCSVLVSSFSQFLRRGNEEGARQVALAMPDALRDKYLTRLNN